MYEKFSPITAIVTFEGVDIEIELPAGGMSVVICKKCLSNPKNLDSKKIQRDLVEAKWEKEKAEKVFHAVESFKNQ